MPLLDHLLEAVPSYNAADLKRAKFALFSKTNMIDTAIDLFQDMNGTDNVPEGLSARRDEVMQMYDDFGTRLETVVEFFDNEDVLAKIQERSHQKDLLAEELKEFGYVPEMLDTLYSAAKFYFDLGQYAEASQYLYNFRVLSNNAEANFGALWGKLAAEILSTEWAAAVEDMNLLLEYIDGKNSFTAAQQLQQRAWLLHWSLFIFFNLPDGPEGIVDMFLRKESCCNALQTLCPHLLRYVTVVAIIHRRARRDIIKDIVRIIRKDTEAFEDPITTFLYSLVVEYDFDKAQEQLKLCEKVFDVDFFLGSFRGRFIESARVFIFEIYCQIHSTISIPMLAEKLSMTPDKAEEWIVNLIRDARLNAKIDSASGHVVMSREVPSVYHQVIERTKGLSLRTRLMVDNLDRKGKGKGDRNPRSRKEKPQKK
jgi:translation initiation factor 3 subunit E